MYPLLNQALRQEEYTQTVNRNCQIQGARNVMSKFQVRQQARKTTEVSTVHTSPFSVIRRPTRQRARPTFSFA